MGPVEQLMEWWCRARGWYPVDIKGQVYKCDPDHISCWSKVTKGTWEPATFDVLSKMITPGSVYCDIGTWIGPTVLYGANIAGKVLCLEPDREAYRYLLQNIRLNRLENVMPFNLGLSAETGMARMASPRGKRGDSMTSLLTADNKNSMEVLCLNWQSWFELAGNPDIGSIKMDIEGGEFDLLPTMQEYLERNKPNLYLSLHPHLIEDGDGRYEAMNSLVEVLGVYGCHYGVDGETLELSSLLEDSRLEKGSSCLLLGK